MSDFLDARNDFCPCGFPCALYRRHLALLCAVGDRPARIFVGGVHPGRRGLAWADVPGDVVTREDAMGERVTVLYEVLEDFLAAHAANALMTHLSSRPYVDRLVALYAPLEQENDSFRAQLAAAQQEIAARDAVIAEMVVYVRHAPGCEKAGGRETAAYCARCVFEKRVAALDRAGQEGA